MAKVRTLVIGCGHTVNMGNYETMHPHVSVEVEVGADEEVKEAYRQASALAQELWATEAILQAGNTDQRRRMGLMEHCMQLLTARQRLAAAADADIPGE